MSYKTLIDPIYLHPLALFLPSMILLFFLFKWLYNKSSKPLNLPPSPPKLPMLGHLHKLGMLPHLSLQSISNQYGDLILIYLGSNPTVIVSSPKMAKQILKTHDAVISSRAKSTVVDKLLYNSRDVAAAPYGEYWRQMKSILVLHLLSNKRVRSYASVRAEETAHLVEKIQHNVASVVDLSAMFVSFTNDVTCRVAFGRRYSSEEYQQSGVDFMDALNGFMEMIGSFHVGDFIPWLGWVNRVTGLDERLDNVAKQFDIILEKVIKEHEEKDLGFLNENQAKDFVDVLLELQREDSLGFRLQTDSIKAMILDAFLAGTETSSTVLEWVMTELLRNPHIMKQLQMEVRGIAQGKQHITESDLERMKYLKAVIKETLRLHPPIPLLVPRESTQSIKVNGYDIPAKTRVIFNTWAIHRDPRTWEEADEFRPERFLNSSIDFKGHDFELIPFGSGRRTCPGLFFANVSIELVLANLINSFNWKLPNGVDRERLDMSQSSGLTIRRKVPLLAVAT